MRRRSSRACASSVGGRLRLYERDQLVFDLVLLYRRGPRQHWAPVLLEVMAPPIFERLARYRPEEPVIDQDDLYQQLLLEVLEAALTIPLHGGPAWLERRLLMRAGGNLSRRLRKEARLRHLLVPLSEWLADEEARP